MAVKLQASSQIQKPLGHDELCKSLTTKRLAESYLTDA